MALFHGKYRIESIRLKNFDYSQVADYYITVCCKNRGNLLGRIVDNVMVLNPSGLIVQSSLRSLEKEFPNMRLDEHVVMPDHVHAIIRIIKEGEKSLSCMAQSFKSRSAIAINKAAESPGEFKWQKGFYDRIIRHEIEFYFVSEYIKNNPLMADPENYYREWWEIEDIRNKIKQEEERREKEAIKDIP